MDVDKARLRLGLSGPGNAAQRHALIKAIGPLKPAPELTHTAYRRFAPLSLRRAILQRDKYRCGYCGKPVSDRTANIDHLIPWPEGLTELANLVTACRDCNRIKAGSFQPIWRRRRDSQLKRRDRRVPDGPPASSAIDPGC